MKTFGENLKDLMSRQRISVRDLATKLGVPAKTVQEWVGSGGRTPRNLDTIKRLADYLNVSVHFLLYGENDPRADISTLLETTEIHTGLYEITIKKVKRKGDV